MPHPVASTLDLRILLGGSVFGCLFLEPVLHNVPGLPRAVAQMLPLASAALMLLCAVLAAPWRSASQSIQRAALSLLLAYPVFCALSIVLQGQGAWDRAAALDQLLALGQCLMMFAYGMALTRHAPTPSLLLVFAAYVAYILSGYGAPTMKEMGAMRLERGLIFEYQIPGDLFAIVTLLLLLRLRSAQSAVAVALLAASCVLMIPSRSSAVFGTLGILVVLLVRWPRPAGLLTAAGAILVLFFHEAVIGVLAGTRLGNLLGPGTDQSAEVRESLFGVGLEVIRANPLWGHYQFQMASAQGAGLPVHSALDLWAQAGIVPFALFLWLLWCAGRNALRAQSSSVWTGSALMGMLTFLGLSWALARIPFTPALFLGCGVVAALRYGPVGQGGALTRVHNVLSRLRARASGHARRAAGA